MKILIVEDDPDILLPLQDDLALEGYQVEGVGDGETALRRLDEDRFDLLLLDVMLPGVDGFEVCRRLRHAEVAQHPRDGHQVVQFQLKAVPVREGLAWLNLVQSEADGLRRTLGDLGALLGQARQQVFPVGHSTSFPRRRFSAFSAMIL